MLLAILRASSLPSNLAAERRPGSSSNRHRRSFGMLSETMRPPTNIFFTMLLGIAALLFGFGIAAVITGALPDILADLGEAARALFH
jgi:hypothetical protein